MRTTAVNASSAALSVWNLVKSLVPKQTAAKMKVLGDNYQDGMDELGLDSSFLPGRLKGECNCSICYNHFNRNRSIINIEKGKTKKLTLRNLKKGKFDFLID